MEKRYESQTRLMQSIKKRQDQLNEIGAEIAGSLCQHSGKCKNPNCDCHKGVKKHFSWQLTSSERGKTKTVYVPVDCVPLVEEWVANHRLARKLRKEVSDLCKRYIRTVVPKNRVLDSIKKVTKGGENNE